jgi:hypothetical protein
MGLARIRTGTLSVLHSDSLLNAWKKSQAESSEEENRKLLTEFLQVHAAWKRGPFHYHMAEDFLLQHGKWFEPRPLPKGTELGVPKNCFGNSILCAARDGLKYIEGYAVPFDVPLPILHGWNANERDELIDTTWGNCGHAYFGVEFSVERADDATWNGDACVLEDWKRDYPIFQKPWTGEDFTIKWPRSIRIELARTGDVELLAELQRELEEAEE